MKPLIHIWVRFTVDAKNDAEGRKKVTRALRAIEAGSGCIEAEVQHDDICHLTGCLHTQAVGEQTP